MAAPVYSLTLHQLSSDAKRSGLEFADEHLLTVTAAQVREFLGALAEVAARQSIYDPATPEIRIKTDRDVFVVRTRYRRLCLVGWEAMLRGEEHSIDIILTAISGNTDLVKIAPKVERSSALSNFPYSRSPFDRRGFPRWAKVSSMLVVVLACNTAAVWMLVRPKPSFGPPFTLLPEEESHTLFSKIAGEYVTGAHEGDRRMVVDADGTLRLSKYGPKRAIVEEVTRPTHGGLSQGLPALITADPYVVAIKDPNTVVFSGNTYHRRIQ
jgi:hypothetical protein